MDVDAPASLPMGPCLAVATAALQHSSSGDSAIAFTTRLAPSCRSCLSSVRPWKLRLQATQACEAMLNALSNLIGRGATSAKDPQSGPGGVASARRALLGTADSDAGVLLACVDLKSEKVASV